MGLLCYENAKSSELSYLLNLNQREAVADYINQRILGIQHFFIWLELKSISGPSVIERLLKQLVLTEKVYLEKNNSMGPQFKLKI